MTNRDKIVKSLQQFGMSQKEACVYLAALSLGPTSVQNISRCSNLNRATVHVITKSLIEKGLFGESRKGKKRIIFAEDPEKIENVIKEERSNIKAKEEAFCELLPFLRNIDVTQEGRPKVRFYEGEQGFYDVCQRSLDKAKNEILFISSLDAFHDVTSETYDNTHYIPTRKNRKIFMKALVFKSPKTVKLKTQDKEDLRTVRFLNPEHSFKSTVFIYGNEFSMITSKAPFLGVVIESKELTCMMREIFNIMWDVSKED